MSISDIDIARHARQAGFSGTDVPIAVAVALAESGGNPHAVNRNDTGGTQSFGLWQINSVHSSLLASGDWRDPASNARMAFAVFQRQGWRAWGVYNSKKYLLFLPRGTAAAGITQIDPGEVIDSLNPFDEIGEIMADIKRGFDFVTDTKNWLRLGFIIGGSGLLLIGLWPVIRQSTVYDSAANVAKAVV